jgi:amino acid adenylation domain-containing protein
MKVKLHPMVALAEKIHPMQDMTHPVAVEGNKIYNDPEYHVPALSFQEKLGFIASYIMLWLCVCILAQYWPTIMAAIKPFSISLMWRPASGHGLLPGARLLQANEQGDTTQMPKVSHGPTPPYPSERCVHELFEDRVQEQPSAVALVLPRTPSTAQMQITYHELDKAAEELARELLSTGVGRGSVVALILARSVAQVVAVYGVLKAGAAFLPMDAESPSARMKQLLIESAAATVVGIQGDEACAELVSTIGIPFVALAVDGALDVRKFGGKDTRVEHTRPKGNDMSMLIYTSGSTGQPKGIVYEHRFLMHGAHFFGECCEMDAKSVALLKSPYFWAVIEYEMFPALMRGGRLIVASAQGHKSPDYLVETISSEQVSVLMITPQVLELVLDVHTSQENVQPLRSLKSIVTVGEPLSSFVANKCVNTSGLNARLCNFYGASESPCTVYRVPLQGIDLDLFPSSVPAGLPQPHAQVYVMEVEQLEGQGGATDGPWWKCRETAGGIGEICFGGVLAQGYWQREDLSRLKWVKSEEYGLIYRTGDLGRWRNGVLEVTGRIDRQAKIRGVRVEPEEVEAKLKELSLPALETMKHPVEGMNLEADGGRSVLKEVAVVASTEPSELVAFVSLRASTGKDEVTVDTLRAHCQAHLTPAYVPKFFVILPELPSLTNGKLNLAELKKMATQLVEDEGEVVMDSLGQMKKLAGWAVLETKVIHRCYAFWMMGVVLDHFLLCGMAYCPEGCFVLYRKSVKPWVELFLRSMGNDQDMMGFIMLGAFQESRPGNAGDSPEIKLGIKELCVFLLYIAMNIQKVTFTGWFGGHSWYFMLWLHARVYLRVCQGRLPRWVQVVVAIVPQFFPLAYWDVCSCEGVSPRVQVLVHRLIAIPHWGRGCPIQDRRANTIFIFYVWCFHYSRRVMNDLAARQSKIFAGGSALQRALRCVEVRTWAAIALASSMTLGLTVAEFYYPNKLLDGFRIISGDLAWVLLEIPINIVQPTLFALAMIHVPLDLSLWGSTTLGCYVFHFYVSPQAFEIVKLLCDKVWWDPSGLITLILILVSCAVFNAIVGLLGNSILLAPVSIHNAWMTRRAQLLGKSP